MYTLSDFARAFRDHLYRTMPELVAHSTPVPSDHSRDFELHLWIPPARSNTDPMVAETCGHQINIYFDLWCTFLGIDEADDPGDGWTFWKQSRALPKKSLRRRFP